MEEVSFLAVESILNYIFKNKLLLLEALTHPSFSDSASYQRLEFLGDSVLGLAFTNHSFLLYPQLNPSHLSHIRAANVSNEKLARVAVMHGLYRFLRHNAAAPLDNVVMEFSNAVRQETTAVAHGGSVKAPKVLADIVESLAAAVYLDVNFDLQMLWVIFRGLLEPIVTLEDLHNHPQPITKLYELCHKQGKEVDIINLKNGTKNIASVFIDGEFLISGSAEKKEIAKLNAAKRALPYVSYLMQSDDGLSDPIPMDCTNSKNNKRLKSSNREMEESVFSVERILNYSFNKKHLLKEALTHSSCMDSTSYQRLEFIGDAALGLALSNYFFLAYPELDPGQLTLLRAANLSTEKLARVAIRHGLYRFMRHNATSLNTKVREFVDAVTQEEHVVVYGGSVKAPKVLADIVESLAAAIYVDVNFDLERLWVIFRGLLEPIVMLKDLQDQPQPITLLYELCQKKGKEVDILNWKKGTKSIASVYVDGAIIASSSSEQKEVAKLNAAKEALSKLSHMMHSDVDVVMDSINEPFYIENAKRQLDELCGKKKWPKPSYSIEKESGPPHEKKFVCSVQIATAKGVLYKVGDVKTRIKAAENSAASLLIQALQQSNYL